MILKPAQLTPWAGLELGRIVAEETDIPPGIFQVVVSNDNDVAAALTSDPRVDMVTFTGSTAVGRKILAAAAPDGEEDRDGAGRQVHPHRARRRRPAKVLPTAAGGVCTMSGQGCTLATRILLPRAKLAEGLAIMKATMEAFPYGDPWDMKNYSGPSISDVQRDKVLGMIEGAVAAGATLLTGGGKPAHLPRRLLHRADAAVRRRPAFGHRAGGNFGPVVTVTPYDTEEEAVAIANNTIYGSGRRGVQRRRRAGARGRAADPHRHRRRQRGRRHFSLTSPLGGVRQSGLGRRYGEQGFEEYLEIKAIGLPAGG